MPIFVLSIFEALAYYKCFFKARSGARCAPLLAIFFFLLLFSISFFYFFFLLLFYFDFSLSSFTIRVGRNTFIEAHLATGDGVMDILRVYVL